MKIKLSLIIVVTGILFFHLKSYAQKGKNTLHLSPQSTTANNAQKKYTSLLWEITGKGMKKPSYLFGTMHVSNKLVFNLSDSFYNAIKNVEVVALEQNPEVWQQEWADNKKTTSWGSISYNDNFSLSNDRLTQQTFSISNYESKIKLALSSEARMINGMLYRNNVGMEDFEEETYLDMYIYRLGRKLNKIVTGVEDYKESNRIVKEAYLAMYKDKNRKQRYDYDSYGGRKKMEDAYRRGDLDVLDSLEVASVTSDAFQEKFLYKRNEIQANSIDTIIQKHSLFVGVGAAHLPGERGVIELLRKKGYKLRPIYTGQRDGEEKEKIEKIRVPQQFYKQYVEDSVFTVDIPGSKLYRYNTLGNLNMLQYADMSNGSYYMVTRIKTDASLLGHTIETVARKTDSLLYENIPGKIISKKAITRNGYKGFDIVNKTRKGDVQRYNIFILPDEVIIFKISGIADYISDGKEADLFFSSINFNGNEKTPLAYQPPYGGFKVLFPATPFYLANERNDKDRSEWISKDANGDAYFIFKTTVQQYEYIEKDSFELKLMEESFTSSKVLKTTTAGKQAVVNGYAVINSKYTHNDGSSVKVRFLIQGNNYYVVGAKYKRDEVAADNFINSFTITPFTYKENKLRIDTAVGFTVISPLFYKTEIDSSNNFSPSEIYGGSDEDNKQAYEEALNNFSLKTIGNDTTGEHVSISAIRFPKYTYIKDSSAFFSEKKMMMRNDVKLTLRKKDSTTLPGNWRCSYYEYGNPGSSRLLFVKSFYRNGAFFVVMSQGDTITQMSNFVKTVFNTFTPSDSIRSYNPFEKKSNLLFENYFSKDSIKSNAAIKALSPSLFDSTDLPNVIKAINDLSWKNKNYLSLKKKWISIAGSFKDTATINYLADLYKQVTDTSDLQNAVLDALLAMRTAHSFSTFKTLVLNEPPALTNSSQEEYNNFNMQVIVDNAFAKTYEKKNRRNNYNNNYNFKWLPLFDTLQLSAPLIPDLMDLMVLDDYKSTITSLLEAAVDSGYIKSDQYKQYFNKFLLEAKQALKKQSAYDSKKEMNKLNDKDNSNNYNYNYDNDSYSGDLESYATLLMPFWNSSAEVPLLFNKLLKLRDKKTLLNTASVMIKNGKPVSDSILTLLAADDKFRDDLYSTLVSSKKENLFPAKYKTQELIAKSMLTGFDYSSSNVDTLVYIDKLQVNEGAYNGWVYFFGYKKNNDDDFKIAMCGLQPSDLSKVSTLSNDDMDDDDDDDDTDNDTNATTAFTRYTTQTYKSKENVMPKLQKLLKETLYDLRPSSSRFYGNSDSDDDADNYINDAAKSSRYE